MAALRAATRGSRLALWQTHHVIGVLREQTATLEVDVVRIRTSGDIIQDVPLSSVGSSAFFTREIELALLDGRADFALHRHDAPFLRLRHRTGGSGDPTGWIRCRSGPAPG